jgi:hypothetical protein
MIRMIRCRVCGEDWDGTQLSSCPTPECKKEDLEIDQRCCECGQGIFRNEGRYVQPGIGAKCMDCGEKLLRLKEQYIEKYGDIKDKEINMTRIRLGLQGRFVKGRDDVGGIE